MTKVFNVTLATDVQTVSLIDCQEAKVYVEDVMIFKEFVWSSMKMTIIPHLELKNVGKLLQIAPTNQVQLNMNLI